MSSMQVLQPKGTPTIFGDLMEKNITFLVDTSGSMYPFIDVVKEHVLEVLLSRAYRTKDTMFNIMEFSSTVIPWADQMVKCTPQTVTLAGEWIKALTCKTGTNTLDAVLAALQSPTCDSVYLITDGLPDQPPEVILQHVAMIGQHIPIHCIYMTGINTDTPAFDFLQSLAIESAGSFHLISVSHRGQVEHVKAVVQLNHGHSKQTKMEGNPTADTNVNTNGSDSGIDAKVEEIHQPHLTDSIQGSISLAPEVIPHTTVIKETEAPAKFCSVQTSLDNNPDQSFLTNEVLIRDPVIQATVLQTQDSVLRYPNTAWETQRLQPRLLQRQVMTSDKKEFGVNNGAVLLMGMRVLARRDRDGLYCPGTVKEQITTNRCFLIEFDRDPSGGRSQHLLQETGVYDIIPFNTAMRHPIVPGDKVLAPMDGTAYCFAPGVVLEGIEGRSSGCAADSEHLVISLYNGKSVKITTQMAVWIPQNLHERIKLETQMPLSARQYLINNPQYPSNMPPGYILVPNTVQRRAETVTHVRASTGSSMYVPVYPMEIVGGDFHMPSVRESAVKSTEVHKLIPGTSMTKEDLNRKVMSQLIQHKMVQSEEITTVETTRSQPKSCLKKSVTFRESNVDFDSGISSIQTDDEERYEEKQDRMKEVPISRSREIEIEYQQREVDVEDRPREIEVEDDLETLEMRLPQLDLTDTNDSGIEIEYSARSPRTEPALLFSMPNHSKPSRPQTSIPENRPPWRNFSKGGGGGSKTDSKSFRETALKCPPQARSQPIYLDAELAFDMDIERPYPESRPVSVLSTYDSDYISYPTERPQLQYGERPQSQYGERSQSRYGERPQSQYGERSQSQYGDRCQSQYSERPQSQYGERPQSQYGERPESSQYGVYNPKDYPSLRSSIKYDNSYRYPADNISPNTKVNAKIQQSPMLHAEKIMYFDPQAPQKSSTFSTINHSAVPVTEGPLNRKSVFRTVNPNGIKSDRLHLEMLLRNQHTAPHPPTKAEIPAHKKFATRDMVREAKETAFMEYRRMQVVSREESFKDREDSNHKMQKARMDRCKTVAKQHKQSNTVLDVTTVRVCRKYTADVQRRDIQRQQDDQEKVNKTREAKRAVSFKIAEKDQSRAERETDKELHRLKRLESITQRRMDIEAQREKQIQDTIARRKEIKTQNLTARSVNHLEQIGDRRHQDAARDGQMRQKEIQRREHYRKKEEDSQRRKDLRLAVHQNKLMDLRSQVLP